MEILLVRHGQSTADLEGRCEGRADFNLTELGLKQAECLSKWIKDNYKIDTIICSPLKRASQTAEFISKETETEVSLDDNLMEWNNGLLAGMLKAEADEKYPIPKGGRKPHDEIAQSESYINFRARAETFLSRLLDRYNAEDENLRLCIVSHGGMIAMLVRSFLRLPITTEIGFSTGDTGVHLLKISGKERKIIFFNRQEHLISIKSR